MMCNVGRADRTLRVIVGVVLLGSYFVVAAPANRIGLIGFLPIGTALVGWCPALFAMRLRT